MCCAKVPPIIIRTPCKGHCVPGELSRRSAMVLRIPSIITMKEGITVSQTAAEQVERKRGVGLTDSQLRILGYIASCGAQGCSDIKNAIAEKLGVCPKTVDRAVRRMRDDGLIVSTARFDENGSQLGNVYFIGAGPR